MDKVTERANFLIKQIEATYGPVETVGRVWLECDGCKMIVKAPTSEIVHLLASGWQVGDLGGKDFCPGCRTDGEWTGRSPFLC